jgi:hypothetical protein
MAQLSIVRATTGNAARAAGSCPARVADVECRFEIFLRGIANQWRKNRFGLKFEIFAIFEIKGLILHVKRQPLNQRSKVRVLVRPPMISITIE